MSIAEVRLRSPFIVCPKTSSDGLNLRDSWNNSCAANNSRWIPLSSLSQFPSSRYSSCSLVFEAISRELLDFKGGMQMTHTAFSQASASLSEIRQTYNWNLGQTG